MNSTSSRPGRQDEAPLHPRNVILVRHGETDRNIVSRKNGILKSEEYRELVRGVPDHRVALTALGKRQAIAVGRHIIHTWGFSHFDAWYDSGYRRTVETLDLVLKCFPAKEQAGAHRRSRLEIRERTPGYIFEMVPDDVQTYFPWWAEHRRLFGSVYSRPPGGESIAEAWQRVHTFLTSLRRRWPGKDVLVVNHGRVMMGFKYWMEKRPASEVDAFFDYHKNRIRNGDTWWYRYSDRDRVYKLVATFRPTVGGKPPRKVN
ncbi:histidine phosphatase family protein [candidate division WOR-3 bacterium]|nr:histidine phosphatase family protein [candidate division WOR-3 bacterium]